jgi:hypothetical protein
MPASTEMIVFCMCVLALTPGCDRHKRETDQISPSAGECSIDGQAAWFIQVHYGGKLALAGERSPKSATNLIRPNELSRHVPQGSNRVALIEVPSERILKDGTDEIWLTTEAVLRELPRLGFQRAVVETHRWGQAQIVTNVTFPLK